jgi:hypothetical protein
MLPDFIGFHDRFRVYSIRVTTFAKLATWWRTVNVAPGDDSDLVTRLDPRSPATLTQAYTFALDRTPAQILALRSHIGGSRFAYNALLA